LEISISWKELSEKLFQLLNWFYLNKACQLLFDGLFCRCFWLWNNYYIVFGVFLFFFVDGMKLLIVRHGETFDNIENLITWQKDVTLTPEGEEQAKSLVKKLAKEKIDIIYCSTLIRAKQTISPYLLKYDVDVVYTDSLKEMDLGKFNWGKAEDMQKERGLGLDHNVWGWESLRELYDRAFAFLEKLKSKDINETILLVGHNAINRNIIGIIKWDTIEEINKKKERYPNTSVLTFEFGVED